jgi:hypothetical protein
MMTFRFSVLMLALLCFASPFCVGQESVPAMPAQTPAPVPASALLQPSLGVVKNTLGSLRFEKWKKGTVRDEASDHAASILRDLDTNLPPLMTAADAAPGSTSKAIPLVKHLDAVYDVLLRVEEASRVSAPGDQIAALQQALDSLEKARIALDDRLERMSAAQEKQIVQLQTALQARTTEASKAETSSTSKPCTPAPAAQKAKRVAAKKKTPTPNPTADQKTTPK